MLASLVLAPLGFWFFCFCFVFLCLSAFVISEFLFYCARQTDGEDHEAGREHEDSECASKLGEISTTTTEGNSKVRNKYSESATTVMIQSENRTGWGEGERGRL